MCCQVSRGENEIKWFCLKTGMEMGIILALTGFKS